MRGEHFEIKNRMEAFYNMPGGAFGCRRAVRISYKQQYETVRGTQAAASFSAGLAFPVVWTLLFAMMGIASYIIIMSGGRGGFPERNAEVRSAIILYGLQLAVNFCWPLLFFNMKMYLAAFMWLLLLWVMIVTMFFSFYRLSKTAGYLVVPYVLWVTFAGYLNLGIYFLN